MLYGAYKSQRRAENLARVDALRFEILSFDGDDARAAGEIRAQLVAVERTASSVHRQSPCRVRIVYALLKFSPPAPGADLQLS